MQKDLKIGMIAGTILVIIAVLWLATRPQLSIEARVGIAQPKVSASAAVEKKEPSPPRFVMNLPGSSAATSKQPSKPPSQQTLPKRETPKFNTPRYHIVQRGDTLSGIAEKYYGSASEFQKIINANPALKNPNKLNVGAKLIIPK